MSDQKDWWVILTETGVDSVWPSEQDAADWWWILAKKGLIDPRTSYVVSFDPGDEAHCMAVAFSPQLNR